jgi:uncharacterized protein (TIGR02569 family)
MESSNQRPAAGVVESFGGDPGKLERTVGGQGRSWRAGGIVLKPADGSSDPSWLGPILAALPDDDRFRVATPVPSTGGAWSVGGWQATTWLAGTCYQGRWPEIIEAADAMHSVLGSQVATRPSGIGNRSDPWAIGDRVAWGEESAGELHPAVADLAGRLAPLIDRQWHGPPAQLIHGDLGPGNVLFADDVGLPPAILDFSPYWRPAAFATAVLIVDALAWENAPRSLATGFMTQMANSTELIARAIIYRLVAAAHLTAGSRIEAEVAAYGAVASLLDR